MAKQAYKNPVGFARFNLLALIRSTGDRLPRLVTPEKERSRADIVYNSHTAVHERLFHARWRSVHLGNPRFGIPEGVGKLGA